VAAPSCTKSSWKGSRMVADSLHTVSFWCLLQLLYTIGQWQW
jgi:hypothetical protein